MEQQQSNVRLVEDPTLADKIMFVVEQIRQCGGCRFAACVGGGRSHQSVICRRGMHPYGVDDGCDLWAPRV